MFAICYVGQNQQIFANDINRKFPATTVCVCVFVCCLPILFSQFFQCFIFIHAAAAATNYWDKIEVQQLDISVLWMFGNEIYLLSYLNIFFNTQLNLIWNHYNKL